MPPPKPDHYLPLIDLARQEDLGAGDITSQVTILPEREGRGRLVFRETGILCGIPVIEQVLKRYDIKLLLRNSEPEGRRIAEGQTVAEVAGPLIGLLAAERVMLNFLQRLSGVASLTARYVEAVAGTPTQIYDTRKTTPGWRELEKYAVRTGGGRNHRHGLYDAVLIKDNHLAALGEMDLSEALREVIGKVGGGGCLPAFIEVEVDTLDQLREVLSVPDIDIVLLDNMSPAELREAVALRNHLADPSRIQLEASGGITLSNVRDMAQTGVERISIGALTHSAANLDISLDLE